MCPACWRGQRPWRAARCRIEWGMRARALGRPGPKLQLGLGGADGECQPFRNNRARRSMTPGTDTKGGAAGRDGKPRRQPRAGSSLTAMRHGGCGNLAKRSSVRGAAIALHCGPPRGCDRTVSAERGPWCLQRDKPCLAKVTNGGRAPLFGQQSAPFQLFGAPSQFPISGHSTWRTKTRVLAGERRTAEA